MPWHYNFLYMSLSKSHATLDYFDTSMSVSWRGGYIPSPEKKININKSKRRKKKPQEQQKSQNKNGQVYGEMDWNW